MNVRTIDITAIDIGDRIRALDPAWVALLAEEIGRDGQVTPVRVVARGNRFVLIDGARRVAAMDLLGSATITAVIEPEAALADAAFVRLGEIKGNLMRAGLTVLDRAYVIAAWREIYESVQPPVKRGRRTSAENAFRLANISETPSGAFVKRFSEAAKQVLKLTENEVYRSLKIARIDPAFGRRLTGHPSADHQSGLLALAEQPAERQAAVIDLLTGDAPKAATVREAIDLLDGRLSVSERTPAERVHSQLSRLSEAERWAFFEEHADDILVWREKRVAERLKPPFRIVN